MAPTLGAKLRHAYNAFTDQSAALVRNPFAMGANYGVRPDRPRLMLSNERSIISSIYTRIAIDVASIDIRHVRLDKEKRYVEDIDSRLNDCLELEANLDQASRAFIKDVVMTMFNSGVAAVVAVDTTLNPETSGGYDVVTMRVGDIVNWYPRHIRVNLYNEAIGRREEIPLEKRNVAIVENPLYEVMNEPNSTLQRLIRKLNLLDSIDEQSGSGKLDMIIQLPYVIKTEARRQQAETRRKDIEMQLKGSKYGIAYTDGTEKITQLNRPVENNLMKQVEYLFGLLYSQLGITEEVMNGTADEKAMINYQNRTLVPILEAIVQAMRRSFLTKTARTQGQSIEYFRDPFKLIPMSELAEIADKFNRNEIVTGNEFRGFIGLKPSKDPKADELRNSNMPLPAEPAPAVEAPVEDTEDDETAVFNDAMDEIDKTLDGIFEGLGVPANDDAA